MAQVALQYKEEILDGLNEQQKNAVVNYEGSCAVIACPGAGKTRTLIARAAYMISAGVNPRNILLFTFTRKAANEIKERVENIIGEVGSEITVGTYHSFCVKLLRQYCNAIGFSRNFSIYDEDDKLSALQEVSGYNKNDAKGLARYISSCKMKLISPAAAKTKANGKEEVEFAIYYERYQLKMKSANAFDFDDLIYQTIRMLELNPDIKEKVNKRYTYITCDEAHDSSPEDLRLIELLGGDKMNVCLILDPDQSIYSFRGADMEAVYDFLVKYDYEFFLLECNYRSTATIVNAAKSVIENNDAGIPRELNAFQQGGLRVLYSPMGTQKQEATRAVQIIKAYKKKFGYSNNDFTILYRTSFLSRNVEEAFLKNNIPYKVVSGLPFYSRKEVKDILCYLRLLANPNDVEAFKRIVNIPKRGIGEKSLKKLLQTFNEYGKIDKIDILSFMGKLEKEKGSAKGIANFNAFIGTIKEYLEGHSINEVIEEILNMGYKNYLNDFDADTAEDRVENVKELATIASVHVLLDDFLACMSLNEEVSNDEDADAVTMMTMHASKGLEFPVVIIVGASDGITPHFLSIKEHKVDEERRLWYVAMTRAQKQLCILRSEFGAFGGRNVELEPSRFINEIDKKYIQSI